MSNLSTLQRNMLATMSDEAGALYLRGCERHEWVACQAAWAWDRLVASDLSAMVQAAGHICAQHGIGEGQDSGVLTFFRERIFRAHFPDGRPPVASPWGHA